MISFFRRRGLGSTSCQLLADQMEYEVNVVRNPSSNPPPADVILRWGCTASVWAQGAVVLNAARAIHRVSDKAGFRKLCAPHSVPVYEEIAHYAEELVTPLVARPAKHAGGRNFTLCNTRQDCINALVEYGQGCYFSPFRTKLKEFRAFVVGGRVTQIIEKVPQDPTQLVWNHSGPAQSRFVNIKWGDWPLDVARIACVAHERAKLDFGAYDIMLSEEGGYELLEGNTGPSILSEYTAQCFGKGLNKLVADALEGKSHRERNPLFSPNATSWKHFIHPSLSNKAVQS